MSLHSNSSDSTGRQLLRVINDNASASGTVGIEVLQNAANKGILIDQNGNGPVRRQRSGREVWSGISDRKILGSHPDLRSRRTGDEDLRS